jgi:hypothetical protein
MTTLTPLQERIFNAVTRAGVAGICGNELFALAYDGQLPRYRGGHHGKDESQQRTTLKANIWHINKRIKARGLRIVGSPCAGGWYRLIARELPAPPLRRPARQLATPVGQEEPDPNIGASHVPKSKTRAANAGSA